MACYRTLNWSLKGGFLYTGLKELKAILYCKDQLISSIPSKGTRQNKYMNEHLRRTKVGSIDIIIYIPRYKSEQHLL